jgi:hypothetical protein
MTRMKQWHWNRRMIPWVFWFCSFATVAAIVKADAPGWDLQVYTQAIEWIRAGQDPYVQSISAQRAFDEQHDPRISEPRPLTYVYSPITLPVLRLAGTITPWLRDGLYWLAYALAILAQIWVMMQLPDKRERQTFIFLAPAAMFFPGLLQHNVLFSGNLVYILYGLIFSAAYRGWKNGKWGCFYAAVLISSCCKAPLLTLLAMPLFSAQKQWRAVAASAAAGIILFAGQAWLWPQRFNNYLQAVEWQLRYNRDFGFAPSGMLGRALLDSGLPYLGASTALYLLFSMAMLGALDYFSRLFFRGQYPFELWAPVMLIGTVLLNPRIKEYDVAILTLPMALLWYRLFGSAIGSKHWAAIIGSILLLALNVIAHVGNGWIFTEMILMLALLAGGCRQLTRQKCKDNMAKPDVAPGVSK